MLEPLHQVIFYPEDPAALSQATQVRTSPVHLSTLPSALLCPHASYDQSLEALHRSFALTTHLHAKLVVVLVPLHQEVLMCDEPAFLFSQKGEGMVLGGNPVRFATSLLAYLQALYAPHLALEASYFEEESAFELTLPFINSYLPNTEVLGLAVGTCTKTQLETLERLLTTITDYEEQTLFIVSTNANALLPNDVAAEHAQHLAACLRRGDNLWEAQQHHLVSCCNLPSLEAIRRQKWARQGWNINSWFCKGQEYPHPVVVGEGKEKIVWHLSASLGEKYVSETDL
ncbi:MAG: AmmeMemoRadiSam system protein B [Sphaerochaeta sp.]|nr:AmmeMemoRadiSam system protein B [Sphaerochaeta sp.]